VYKKQIVFFLILGLVFSLMLPISAIAFEDKSELVNPMDFGAVGDGITNDTKAVQKAINYAASNNKVLFIPEGVFSVRNLEYKKGLSIQGNGTTSILKADKSCKVWDSIFNIYNITGVRIDGVVFDGNKGVVDGDDQSGTVNIWIDSCKDVEITNNTFQHNWFLGVCVKNSDDLYFHKNKFIDIDCGIETADYPSNNIVIDDNYFDGAEMSEPISIYGMKAGYHENITIINNTIKNHIHGSGILLRAAKNVTVKNNIIDNCATGIYVCDATYDDVSYGVSNVVIKNNTIKNQQYEGILLEQISDSQITSNTIEKPGTFGILTMDVENCEIDKNNIINAKE